MNKVLIIGPNFFYFNESIRRAFETLGWNTRVLAYDTPIHPYNLFNKCRYKLAKDKQVLRKVSRETFSRYVENKWEKYQPEFVFILNGEYLTTKVVQNMHEKSKVAVWFYDSITKYAAGAENIPYVDEVFCYEQTDIPLIAERYGKEAHFLPQAADTTLYHPIAGCEKKYDIVFAGDIWQSKKRQQYLQAIVEHFADKRICIWGIYKPWYKGVWRWLTRERRDVYRNCNTTAEVLNRTYNEARVVLNIHNEQQKDGANPKVYEIAASGAVQVCDGNPFIERLNTNGELLIYNSIEEAIHMIEKALSMNDTQALNIRQHTFVNRIDTVLKHVKL